ncbi:hypothetical protein JAN5088_02745 [Jannaschia rubra]|uniref:Uncharacterized protein n=1 Tax=Jannaschia rubra TaxID=282197 RepID=A0A0M6XN87_9RHOB|nr:hypothetical protein JAN5088_00419 [Jannaschia rubra]CTQ33956.1 hypothetical protein JAN5088_02745 [Jannaschia rubra]
MVDDLATACELLRFALLLYKGYRLLTTPRV